jgi:hypothetical protein
VLDQVDNILRTLLMTRVPGIGSEDQVRFQPPDEAWRTAVTGLGQNALNVYLVDLRERRDLRSNEWIAASGPQGPTRSPEPTRVDCHYLVSAWSPATVTPAIEPTLDEHALLYAAAAALLQAAPVRPAAVYPPGSAALAAVDPLIRDGELPLEVLPPEGFLKLSEFWSSMGTGGRWKPAIWLVVTVPVAMPTELSGPLVTTRIIEFRTGADPATAETLVQIAGTVTGAAGPLEHAVVRLERDGAVLQTYDTAADGRFTFGALRTGPHVLGVTAAGVGAVTRGITVPDPQGHYDIAVP